MNKHTELRESQLAMGRFYEAVKEAGGLVSLAVKIGQLCNGQPVTLTPAEASAIACSLDSTIRLGNAVQLHAREQAKKPAATGVHVGVGTPEGDTAFAEIINSSNRGY